jgi:branched-chain amino acid transport system ATP-binding protein
MLLKVVDLRVNYGGAIALNNVCLEIAQGNLIALLGANGAGKTTLLRTVFGLERVASGQIWFQGMRIDGFPPQRIAKLGISLVFAEGRLFPFLSVLKNIKLGAYLRTDTKQLKEDLTEIWDLFPVLRDRTEQPAGTLSGGEQRMVSIARGLISKPNLLLLDEPSLGLSPLMVENIIQIIIRIRQERTTILLAEQNANLALEISDKAYVLQTGKVVLTGDAKALADNEEVKRAYLGR